MPVCCPTGRLVGFIRFYSVTPYTVNPKPFGCTAELVAASTPVTVALGFIIYVAVVLGFLGAANWLVHSSVYKSSACKAHFVIPNIANDPVNTYAQSTLLHVSICPITTSL